MRVVVRPRVDGREVREDGQDRAEQGADGDVPHVCAAGSPQCAGQLNLNFPTWFDAIAE